ncbi:MAG: ATP-binding protein [Deltaproteobacteria bacterium]|nr:ATP-binding protein [Deltaproteobacteria bacterium]
MAAETQRLVHELQVHQIELELQNEELERTRAEAEEALARYTDLYELAPVGYLTLDPGGEIRQANLTGARLLGLERSRLIGRRLGLLVAAECHPAFNAFLAKVFEGRTKEACEVVMHPEGAPPLTLELTAAASEDGLMCRVAAADITERKRAEQERERLLTSLAQSDRLASVGMLAAGVAHEINNPLSYVLYNVESLAQDLPKLADTVKRCTAVLREQVGDAAFAQLAGDGDGILRPAGLDDAVERAREALEGTYRIKDLSRGLSTFSRIERVELTLVDVTHVVETVIRMTCNEIKYRARLVKDLGPLPATMASEGKLSQVFLNLLVNAAHSIDEGDVENNSIRIRSWTEGDDNFVEIADTGKGIPPESLAHVFEPFHSTRGVSKDSGIGLTICRNLVTEIGGDIRAESQVGKGSRFVVRLPVTRDKPREERAMAVSDVAPQAQGVRGRILVVDDEKTIRTTMVRLFGREHEVICAASGRAGRAILKQDRSFDLILCDLMMPEVTGMDLHKWLKERDPALAARIVFITGGAFTPRAAEYLAGAGNLKVEKPFDADKLKKLVSKLIAAAKSGR